MRKIISALLLAAGLTAALPTKAQLHFGVKGGLNVSKVSLSSSDWNGKNRTGWFIGPMAEFTVPVVGIGIEAAALYSQTDVEANGIKTSAKLKSVEVPVSLKWSYGAGSLLGVYLAVGPQFGFNVGKRDYLYYDLKKNSTSFNVGGGLKLLRHLQAGVNYNFALSHTGKFGNPASSQHPQCNLKNNTWQVSLAYLF